MQDGNVVYTNLKSIKMLSKYQSVLTKLKGQSVCLVLDSTHSTIEKVNCDDLNQKKKVEKKAEKKEDTSEKKETTEDSQQETQIQEEQPSQTEPEDTYDDPYAGLEYDENLGLYYDPNTGYYMDENGTYYYWDDQSQSFVEAY